VRILPRRLMLRLSCEFPENGYRSVTRDLKSNRHRFVGYCWFSNQSAVDRRDTLGALADDFGQSSHRPSRIARFGRGRSISTNEFSCKLLVRNGSEVGASFDRVTVNVIAGRRRNRFKALSGPIDDSTLEPVSSAPNVTTNCCADRKRLPSFALRSTME